MQYIIGMDILFQGFITSDQKGNSNTKKYGKANKIIVKECTKFYFDCWLARNDLFYSEDKQLYMLK